MPRTYTVADSRRPSRRFRDQAVRRALIIIEAMAGEPFTMQHLCREAGASERTLQYAFQDHFGLSPRKFINIARLNTVRRALLAADPTTDKVSDLAAHRGYWHSGQFAADYRHLFGELPSETLRRPVP